MLVAFHKPYGVLSRFTPDGSPTRTLTEFGFPANVYPIGRLDADSEGLLLLSDEPALNERLLHPRHAHQREYWVQLERIPTSDALRKLAQGLILQNRLTLPCRAPACSTRSRTSPRASRPSASARLFPPAGSPWSCSKGAGFISRGSRTRVAAWLALLIPHALNGCWTRLRGKASTCALNMMNENESELDCE